jgi:hypothetical protein
MSVRNLCCVPVGAAAAGPARPWGVAGARLLIRSIMFHAAGESPALSLNDFAGGLIQICRIEADECEFRAIVGGGEQVCTTDSVPPGACNPC